MKRKPLLLVAEDDPDDQFLLQEALAAACQPGIETYFVWDGVELMDFLRQSGKSEEQPNLILIDLNMPRKDGRAVLKEIRSDPSLVEVPVAVLTTSSHPADALYCQEYGVVAYYRKPGSMAELRQIIGHLCLGYLT